MPKLVVIDTKTNTYAAFDGKTKIDQATFSRPLYDDEVEQFRTNPKSLTGEEAA